MNLTDTTLSGHVDGRGGGRIGTTIAMVLQQLQLPFVLIEVDHRRLEDARQKGFPIVFGDASQPTVLQAARVTSARLVIVTTPAFVVARSVVEQARLLNAAAGTVVRAERRGGGRCVPGARRPEVVQPELEAGLEMTRQALLHLGLPAGDILELSDRLRAERNARGRRQARDGVRADGALGLGTPVFGFRWVRIGEASRLAGRTIGEAHVRTIMGVSVVGAVGTGGFVTNPGPDHRVDAGDVVAVVGEPINFPPSSARPPLTDSGRILASSAAGRRQFRTIRVSRLAATSYGAAACSGP